MFKVGASLAVWLPSHRRGLLCPVHDVQLIQASPGLPVFSTKNPVSQEPPQSWANLNVGETVSVSTQKSPASPETL